MSPSHSVSRHLYRYTIKNVARCWTHETGVLLGEERAGDLPFNEYYQYFGPDWQLHPDISLPDNVNQNTREYIAAIKQHVDETLRKLGGAPSIQMQEIPPDYMTAASGAAAAAASAAEQESADPDTRFPMAERDKHRATAYDLYAEPGGL
jgi:histone deacetylase 3